MKTQIIQNVAYESQQEFANHLHEMLQNKFKISNINFRKKDKDHFTVSYFKVNDSETDWDGLNKAYDELWNKM